MRYSERNTLITTEHVYDDDEEEFLRAIRAHIEKTGHKFPPFSEILAVLKSLGYSKGSGNLRAGG